MSSTLQAVIITLGIFVIAGLFGLIEALGDWSKWLKREEAERTRTTGVIVGFAEERHRYRRRRSLNAHDVTVYYPIVLFRADGVEYELKSGGIVPRDKFQEGQAVDLLYDPNNPTHFHLDRGDVQERSNRGTIIFALVWLVCSLVAIALLLYNNPSLRIQLKRTLYDAIAPLRSAINPSQN